MSAGLLHAMVLLACPVVTLAIWRRFGERPSARRAVLAPLAAAVLALAVGLVSSHLCDAGQAVTQWAIPGGCLAIVLTCVGRTALRLALASLLLVVMASLSFQYADIVHGPTYIGVPVRQTESGPVESQAQWHTWLTGLYLRRG